MSDALKKLFRPEFLNRVDDIIFFKPLSGDDIEAIAKKLLKEIQTRALAIDIHIDFSPDVASLLSSYAEDGSMGARGIRKAVSALIETPLSEEILSGNINTSSVIRASVRGDRVVFIPL